MQGNARSTVWENAVRGSTLRPRQHTTYPPYYLALMPVDGILAACLWQLLPPLALLHFIWTPGEWLPYADGYIQVNTAEQADLHTLCVHKHIPYAMLILTMSHTHTCFKQLTTQESAVLSHAQLDHGVYLDCTYTRTCMDHACGQTTNHTLLDTLYGRFVTLFVGILYQPRDHGWDMMFLSEHTLYQPPTQRWWDMMFFLNTHCINPTMVGNDFLLQTITGWWAMMFSCEHSLDGGQWCSLPNTHCINPGMVGYDVLFRTLTVSTQRWWAMMISPPNTHCINPAMVGYDDLLRTLSTAYSAT